MAGSNVYDKIINDTFNSLNPSVAEMYAGIYPVASSTPTPTYQPGMLGRGQPPRLSTASAEAAAARLAGGSAGLPINPTGQYNAGNPFVLSALTAQQGVKPTGQGGGIKPSWANPPGFGPRFPVQETPEIRQAYSDMVAGKPGAQKRYADLLANSASTMGQANPQATPKRQGLFDLLFNRSGSTGQGGLASLLNQGNSQPYGGRYTPEELAARTAQGIAIGDANRASPTPTHDVAGNNNAFMSTDHQNSVRWQTGY